MTACVVWYCLSVSIGSAPAPEAPAVAKPVMLLAGTDEYKGSKGTEVVYEGVIDNNPADGTVGKPTRFNAYRFTGKDADGKEFVRELYVPGKAFLLAAFVGKRVRVTGKFADASADGKVHSELWPAQVEEIAAAVAPPLPDGVHARCGWQPEDARKIGKRVLVYHSGQELAQALRMSGDDAEAAATEMIGRKLDAPGIDWNKQMVVTVAAGLRGADVDRLAVTRVEVKDKMMTVFYRLSAGPGVGGFGCPAETVLVDRIDGTVRAEEEPAVPASPKASEPRP